MQLLRASVLLLTMSSTLVGCVDAAEPERPPESVTGQGLDRGYTWLYVNGIGDTSTRAAGLIMELYVNYDRNTRRGFAYPYVQIEGGSPPVSYITGYAFAHCGDDSWQSMTFQDILGYQFDLSDDYAVLKAGGAPKCPAGVQISESWFALRVDN